MNKEYYTNLTQKILSKHKLKITEIIREADGMSIRSYVYRTIDSDENQYVLKLFASEDVDAKRRFINEIKAIKLLNKQLPFKYRKWIPRIRWYSVKNKDPYFIYRYRKGDQLGQFVKDFGIKWGIFHDNNFPVFIEFFGVMHEVPVKMLSNNDIAESWGERTAKKEIQYYFENVKGLIPTADYDRVITFFDKYKNRAFKRRCISHRDLYPENILIKEKKSKSFTFLDWEYISVVPIGYDAAFLYLLFWREEFWKAKVFTYFYNYYESRYGKYARRDFVWSFRFSLIILAIRFLYQLETYGDKRSVDYEHAKRSYLYDLEQALKGTVVKPSNVKFYITKHDIQKVANLYDLGQVEYYQIFYASRGNTVVKVKTKDYPRHLIFRFYSQSRSTKFIKNELSILDWLSKHDIETYTVMPDKSGNLYSKITLYGNLRKVAVLTYVDGSKIRRYWANEKASRSAGHMLRRIHDFDVIHGDYSKENVLYKRNTVSGVIDFEWGRFTKSKNAKFSDLARAIALWLVDIRSKKMSDVDFMIFFIEGYFGGIPPKRHFKKLLDAVIDKIEEERDIFVTTIDLPNYRRKRASKRFENAIENVNTLKTLRNLD